MAGSWGDGPDAMRDKPLRLSHMQELPGANLTEFWPCFTTQELSGHACRQAPLGLWRLEDGLNHDTTREPTSA